MSQTSDTPTITRSLRFIGNATTLLHLGSFTVLTDPNFLRRGQRAYLGRGLWSRRLKDPALSIGQLPRLDAVVLSHLHGDHWDRVAQAELDKTPPLVITTHAAKHLSKQGFSPVPLSTWDDHELMQGGESLRMTSMPGIHARGMLGRLLPPVMGSMLEHLLPSQHFGSTSAATPSPAIISTPSTSALPRSTWRSCT